MTNDRCSAGRRAVHRLHRRWSHQPPLRLDPALLPTGRRRQQVRTIPHPLDALHERFLALEDLPPTKVNRHARLVRRPALASELEDLENLSPQNTTTGGDYHPFTPLPITRRNPVRPPSQAAPPEAGRHPGTQQAVPPALKPSPGSSCAPDRSPLVRRKDWKLQPTTLARAEAALEQGRTHLPRGPRNPPERTGVGPRSSRPARTVCSPVTTCAPSTPASWLGPAKRAPSASYWELDRRTKPQPVGADFVPPPHERCPHS